jgi:hypothetical protein
MGGLGTLKVASTSRRERYWKAKILRSNQQLILPRLLDPQESWTRPRSSTIAVAGYATTDLFALALLGHEGVQSYDASMTEWGSDHSLPMETAESQASRRQLYLIAVRSQNHERLKFGEFPILWL